MKAGSLYALLAAMGCSAALSACGSDKVGAPGGKPNIEGGTAEGGGSGGSGAGGKGSGAGGKAGKEGGTDAAPGSGGSGGDEGGTVEAGSGGAGGSGSGGASTTTDAGDAGPDCTYPRCRPKYPDVPYPAANPDSDAKAMLGKILFWEEQIGQLDTMACGTCHRSAAGGSDPRTHDAVAMRPGPNGVPETQPDINSDDLRVAQGVPACDITGALTGSSTPQTTGRKPPTYLDAMFGSQIFWDGRAGYCKNAEGLGGCFYDPDLAPGTAPLVVGVQQGGLVVGAALEAQASGPPANSTEMACAGRTWTAIETKLTTVSPLAKTKPGSVPTEMRDFITQHGSNYPSMFQFVYGSDASTMVTPATDPPNVINARRIVFAIATHERRLKSDQTPWDVWNDGKPEHDRALSVDEIAGFKLFVGKAQCSSCHPPPLFTDNSFHNVGFHQTAWDPGRQAITSAAANGDLAKFKTPTLRNVGLREQFGLLHSGDGPGHSLDTVLQLYNLGGKRSDTGVGQIDPAMTGALGLSTTEINQILAFLRNGLTDPRVTAETLPFDRPKLGTEP